MVYEGRGVKYDADKREEHKNLRGKSIDIAYIGDFRCKFYHEFYSSMVLFALNERKRFHIYLRY
jgi:hypothetical protein